MQTFLLMAVPPLTISSHKQLPCPSCLFIHMAQVPSALVWLSAHLLASCSSRRRWQSSQLCSKTVLQTLRCQWCLQQL